MAGLARVARTLGSLAAGVSIGGRTLLSLDTNPVPADWDHVTKVDPEPDKHLPLAYPLYLEGTSAVSVGGSSDVTGETTEETFELVNAADVPAFHEPSAARHVTERTREQAAFLAIPEVLNGDGRALVGTLGEGIEYAKEELAPSIIADALPIRVNGSIQDRLSSFAAGWLLREAVFEAYIIMNLDSAAAREANVTEDDLLVPAAAKQRAMAAEHHLGSEVVYLEYSGTFGGDEAVDLLEAIEDGVDWARIWYGGGLAAREDTEAVLEAGADAVVVGNVFHEIAREEADLAAAAVEAFDGVPDRSDVVEWIESEVDPAETAAARYLSTITGVADPERRAVRYLAAGVRWSLELQAVSAALDEPDEADVRAALADERVPGANALDDALDGGGALAEEIDASLLAAAHGVSLGDGVATRHFAIEL